VRRAAPVVVVVVVAAVAVEAEVVEAVEVAEARSPASRGPPPRLDAASADEGEDRRKPQMNRSLVLPLLPFEEPGCRTFQGESEEARY
jgi:hypothetical protein